jgi:hypothetical protein
MIDMMLILRSPFGFNLQALRPHSLQLLPFYDKLVLPTSVLNTPILI